MWCRGERSRTAPRSLPWRLVLAPAGAVLLAVLSGSTLAAPADAHPLLERSSPADGQTVLTSPHRIDLWFSEPVRTARVSLYDDEGAAVPGRRTTRATVHTDGTHVALEGLPQLSPAVYEIRWSVVSRFDLHRVRGSVVFGLRVPGHHAAVTMALGSPPEAAYGWLDLLGTAGLTGDVVLVAALLPWARRRRRWPSGRDASVPPAVTRLVLSLGLLSAVAAGLRLTTQAAGSLDPSTGAGAQWRALVGSGLLLPYALRVLSVAALVILLPRLTRPRPAPQSWALVAGTVAALALDHVARAEAAHGASGPVGVLVLACHQAAACAWLGGLFLVALTTRAARRFPGAAVSLWSGFGAVAAVAVAVLTATGLLLAGDRVASVDAALTTPYGLVLLTKVALVAGTLGLGLRHALGLHPWLPPRRRGTAVRAARAPGRGAAVEAGLGATALLAAALLSVSPPARGPQFAPAGPPVDHVTGHDDGLVLTLTVRPNRPGRNLVTVDVTDSRRPAAGTVTRVSTRIAGTAEVRLAPRSVDTAGNGRWQGVVELGAGEHAAATVVTRPGLPDASLSGAVRVAEPDPRDVLVSDSPLHRPFQVGAVLVAATAVLVGFAVRRRGHRAGPGPLAPSDLPGAVSAATTEAALAELEVVP